MMGIGGTKPKPHRLKVLEGNRGRRKLVDLEPHPPEGLPDCPDWLEGEAREEWELIVPQLDAMGVLFAVDRLALAAYCENYRIMLECKRIIAEDGITVPTKDSIKAHPLTGVRNQAFSALRSFLTEFGLTPSSRARLKAPEKKAKGLKERLST